MERIWEHDSRGESISILLIEDNVAEARFLHEVLKGAMLKSFHFTHVKRLKDALERLEQERFDVILLDLTLPDSQGLASLDCLNRSGPNRPIVVLTNTNDDKLALEAVRQGAQDYLVKRHVTGDVLVRSLRYAIERQQTSEALREANEALEIRVQQRTADLAKANELLKQEIQHRQKVQERLELAQKAGKIGTFEWNIQSNEVTWTAELEALYGLAPGSFGGKYRNWIQALHTDDQTRVEQALWQAVYDGTELNTEFRIVSPDGETRWIAAKSSVFYDNAKTPLRMIGIHIDVTEKKQLEAQFLRAQRLESIGTLASGIAHDFNNILTPILAIAQLLPLKLPTLSEQHQQMLKILEVNAKRGADLIKQILSFARGVGGERVCLNVGHLLLEIEKILQQTLMKTIEIRVNIPADLSPVLADATQLHQVLMNLCVNARDAMPHGGVLSIAAENLLIDQQYARMHLDAKVGSYVVITVTDTGIGIPSTILNQIFDPFFTTKEVGQGTGLGLSAVIGIVKSHDGFIDVHSQVGKGSQFKVYLPASQEAIAPSTPDTDMLNGQDELILVVDDEAAICEVTKTTLEAYHYQVLTACDGIDAIALYAKHKHELRGVLMDMMMPSMDGITAIPLLRRLNPLIPVIAMSGLTSTETIAQAKRAGFQEFLLKPFTAKDLLQTLHRVKQSPIAVTADRARH